MAASRTSTAPISCCRQDWAYFRTSHRLFEQSLLPVRQSCRLGAGRGRSVRRLMTPQRRKPHSELGNIRMVKCLGINYKHAQVTYAKFKLSHNNRLLISRDSTGYLPPYHKGGTGGIHCIPPHKLSGSEPPRIGLTLVRACGGCSPQAAFHSCTFQFVR